MDVLAAGGDVAGAQLDGAGQQRRIALLGAFERHIFELHAGLFFQQQPDELAGRPEGGANGDRLRIGQHVLLHVGEGLPRRILGRGDDFRRRGQLRDGLEFIEVEGNAAVQEAGDGALMHGEQCAAVRLGLGGFLGTLVAALTGHGHDLQARGHTHVVDGLFKDVEDDGRATARLPRHDEFRCVTGKLRRGLSRPRADQSSAKDNGRRRSPDHGLLHIDYSLMD